MAAPRSRGPRVLNRDSGEQAAAMGRAGYAWAQAEASFRTMAERYHGLYDVSSDLSSAAMALQGRIS